MSLRFEKIFVLFITILLCAFIIAWSFFLNWGKIQLSSNQPFEIYGLGKGVISCQSKKCLEKLPIGEFSVIFKAENFEDINAQIIIKRWKTTEAILTFKYKPVLFSLGREITREQPEIPEKLKELIIPTWNNHFQKVAYFKQEKSKLDLRIWNKQTQTSQKITSFYNFEKPQVYWGKTGDYLIVNNETDYFLVDLEKKLKNSIEFSQNVTQLKFSSDDQKILYSNGIQFYVYEIETKEEKVFNLQTEFTNLIWKNEDTLLYVTNTKKNTEFYEYDLKEKISDLIFTTELLLPQNLRMSGNGKDVLFESGEEGFELRLVE